MKKVGSMVRRAVSLTPTPIRRGRKRMSVPDYRRAPFISEAWWYPKEHEVCMLRLEDTWSRDRQFQLDIGTTVLSYVCERLPNAARMYPKIAVNGKGSRHSMQYIQQARRFSDTIDFTLTNLHHEGRLERHLREIGAEHCQYVSRGFRVAYWELFKPALEHAIARQCDAGRYPHLTTEQQTQAIRLWGLLAVLMARMMFIGFCEILAAIDNAMDERDTHALVPNVQIVPGSDDHQQNSSSNNDSFPSVAGLTPGTYPGLRKSPTTPIEHRRSQRKSAPSDLIMAREMASPI